MSDRKRVVASLTTMPDKYDKIRDTLVTIKNQTFPLDAIYLGLPDESIRLKEKYPPLPPGVADMCTVVPCKDYGPITKILGALLMEDDPETIIITFDDDMFYPPNMVTELLKKHLLYPDSAIGSAGMLLKGKCPNCAIFPNENILLYNVFKFYVPPEGRKIDCIYGYPGALYQRRFFPTKDRLEEDFLRYAMIDINTLLNDDVIISGYLSKQGIERRIFDGMPRVNFAVAEGKKFRTRRRSEISFDVLVFLERLNKAIVVCQDNGMYLQMEDYGTSDSVSWIILVITFLVIILLLVSLYFVFADKMGLPKPYF